MDSPVTCGLLAVMVMLCIYALERRRRAYVLAFVIALGEGPVSWVGAMVPTQRPVPFEVHLVDERSNPIQAQETGRFPPGDRLYKERNGTLILLKRDAVVTGDEIAQATALTTPQGPSVVVRLDARGAASMLTTTRQNLGHRLGVVFDGRLISVGVIHGVFGAQFEVTGLTIAEARSIAMQFSSAAGLLGPAVAQAPDITTFYQGFIAPVRQKGLSIFLTSCELSDGGKAILFFVLGDDKGHFVEFSDNGVLQNGAGVSLKGGMELEDPSGGIGTIRNETEIVQSLLKSTFILVAPDKLGNVLRVKPKADCSSIGAAAGPRASGP